MITVVTGASSGLGYEVCRQLQAMGHTVYGLSRRGTAPEGVIPVAADVTQRNAIEKAISGIAAREGRIDLLISNAGMGISGPIEFAQPESIDLILQVNFQGALHCAQAVLPYMRSQQCGRIVFISSVAGEIAIPYQAMYSATKSAVTSMALALRNEVKDFGISVTVVEPGDAQTGFTDARQKESLHDDIYPRNSTATASMEKDERSGMTAAYVAKKILHAALTKKPRPVYTVGLKYQLFTGLFRFLPCSLSYWIVGKMYG